MKRAHVPTPTFWNERLPEGEPPCGVLLFLEGERIDEEGEPVAIYDLGYYSSKLKAFLTMDGLAIEEDSDIVAYHIAHNSRGNLIELC
jgi:hypothetical protein